MNIGIPEAISKVRTEDQRRKEHDYRPYDHCCPDCGEPSTKARFVSEQGYYARTVVVRCPCGRKYQFGSY